MKYMLRYLNKTVPLNLDNARECLKESESGLSYCQRDSLRYNKKIAQRFIWRYYKRVGRFKKKLGTVKTINALFKLPKQSDHTKDQFYNARYWENGELKFADFINFNDFAVWLAKKNPQLDKVRLNGEDIDFTKWIKRAC